MDHGKKAIMASYTNPLDSFKNESVFGHIYSLPQGIEVICGNEGEQGILEVKSKTPAYYEVLRGRHRIVLWNNHTMTNPLDGSKQFRREKKKQGKHIAEFFATAGNELFCIEFSQYEVKTSLMSKRQVSSYLPNFCKPIVFQPFAFYKEGVRLGGAYFTLSTTFLFHRKKEHHLKHHAVKKIITGLCLRPNFLMITEEGEYADLVDMVYLNVPQFQEKKIVDFRRIDGIHPYETANVEMLRNLFPFFAAISQTTSPSLFFHLPLAEYLIHGVSIFLEGNMTLEALDVYAKLLVNYESTLRRKLLASLENVTIHFSSPLEVLIQNTILSDVSFTHQFFQNIGVALEQDQSDTSMGRKVAVSALEHLKAQPGIPGVVWTRVWEQALQDKDDLSLKCLTNWSNPVHVAIQSFGSANGEVAVVDDSFERRITVAFRKYFHADSWPSILCFHWLMPVGVWSLSSLLDLPVNPDSEHSPTTEVQKMIRLSSNRISKHGESQD